MVYGGGFAVAATAAPEGTGARLELRVPATYSESYA